jgi:hypothetical protein
LGDVAMAARRRASGVWEEEKRVGEGVSIADAFAARDHIRERKKDEEGKKRGKGKDEEGRGGGGAPALLLTRVVVVRSVPGSRRPPAPAPAPARPPLPAPVGLVAAFESCMLTMRTERGVGLRPPEKGTGVCC